MNFFAALGLCSYRVTVEVARSEACGARSRHPGRGAAHAKRARGWASAPSLGDWVACCHLWKLFQRQPKPKTKLPSSTNAWMRSEMRGPAAQRIPCALPPSRPARVRDACAFRATSPRGRRPSRLDLTRRSRGGSCSPLLGVLCLAGMPSRSCSSNCANGSTRGHTIHIDQSKP